MPTQTRMSQGPKATRDLLRTPDPLADRVAKRKAAERLFESALRCKTEELIGTAFRNAVHGGDYGMVDLLLSRNPRLANRVIHDAFDQEPYGVTPLMVAINSDSVQTVMLLLMHGADLNAEDNGGRAIGAYIKGTANGQDILSVLREARQQLKASKRVPYCPAHSSRP